MFLTLNNDLIINKKEEIYEKSNRTPEAQGNV